MQSKFVIYYILNRHKIVFSNEEQVVESLGAHPEKICDVAL